MPGRTWCLARGGWHVVGASLGGCVCVSEWAVNGARYERQCCSRPLRLDPVFRLCQSVWWVLRRGVRESSEPVVVVIVWTGGRSTLPRTPQSTMDEPVIKPEVGLDAVADAPSVKQSKPASLDTTGVPKLPVASSIGAPVVAFAYDQATPSGKKYQGVSFMYKVARWRATLYVKGGKTKHLGLYKNALDAAKAYDVAARQEFGANHPHVNFDKEGRPTGNVSFAYGGLNGEHHTHGAPELDSHWPRVGNSFQWAVAKFSAGVVSPEDIGTWHPHPPTPSEEDEQAGAYLDSHYGSLHPEPLLKGTKDSIAKEWNPIEKAAFECAINEVDKDFHVISKKVVTKSVRECVRYYYCVWKLQRSCQKWKKSRDDLMLKFQHEEQRRAVDVNRVHTPGRGGSVSHDGPGDSVGSTAAVSTKNDVKTEQFCLCRGPGIGFMLCCEKCELWFHGACIGLGTDEDSLQEDDEFECGNCTENGFPQFASGVGEKRTVKSLANERTVIWDSGKQALLPAEECPTVRNLIPFLQSHSNCRPFYGESEDDSDDQEGVKSNEEDHGGIDTMHNRTNGGKGKKGEGRHDEEDADEARRDFVLLTRADIQSRVLEKGVHKARALARIEDFAKRLEPWITPDSDSSSEDDCSDSVEEESSEESSDDVSDDSDDSDSDESDDSDDGSDGSSHSLGDANEANHGRYAGMGGHNALGAYAGVQYSEEESSEDSDSAVSEDEGLSPNGVDLYGNLMEFSRSDLERIRSGSKGALQYTNRLLPSAMSAHQAYAGTEKCGVKRPRDSDDKHCPKIVPLNTLPEGSQPWVRIAPWNGEQLGHSGNKVGHALSHEGGGRIKALVERIQAHRVAMGVASGSIVHLRKRMERLHGRPRLKRVKMGSDDSRVFTPKQFQTLMWQKWVTHNFLLKGLTPPPYAMHEAAGAGRQFRWSGLRCRSIGLIDGAIVAASPKHFEVYKSQISDLPLTSFNMPPCDVTTLFPPKKIGVNRNK